MPFSSGVFGFSGMRREAGIMPSYRFVLLSIIGTLFWVPGNQCRAQTSGPAPGGAVRGSLVDLVKAEPNNFDALERIAAIANQTSYNTLTNNPSAKLYCSPTAIAATAAAGSCPQSVFLVFSNLRALVQTANALLGNGQPTRYSLNLNADGLGNAFRWTAAEELSAPGTAATQFTKAQSASVASRITALRFGATGFSVAGMPMDPAGAPGLAATLPQARGGGASADSTDLGNASRWGGFLNGSFGWGKRAPSVLEDAFSFDSRDATLGIDYRVSRRIVLGAVAGFSRQRIDFNSSLSVVGGNIHSNGYSFQVFGLYEWDGPYASASIGAQRASYDSTRLITYPSQNIAVPAVNATATGSTTGNTFLATFQVGWTLTHGAFGVEPYLSGDYRHIHLDSFRETSVLNNGSVNDSGVPNAGQAAGFDFDYAPQSIALLDTALGTRVQYTFSPRFGVVVPYIKAEYHHLFDNKPGSVVSSYNAIANPGVAFDIPSDKPNANFYQFAAGTSVVLGHRVQAFLQYQTSARIDYVSTHLVSGGVRGQF
jgi:uncharacterized protein YhjY with autotransporter beta-barrel domain